MVLSYDKGFKQVADADAPSFDCRWTGGWAPVFVFNTFLVIYFTIIGFGIGGYASIKSFVDKIHILVRAP